MSGSLRFIRQKPESIILGPEESPTILKYLFYLWGASNILRILPYFLIKKKFYPFYAKTSLSDFTGN